MIRAWLLQMTRAFGLASILLLLGLGSMSLFGQGAILEFSFQTDPLAISPGGSASALLRVANLSIYEADGIEIGLLDGPVELSPVEPIEVLAAFTDTLLDVPLSIGEDVEEGSREALFELLYTYCIDDLCFQIVEQISLQIDVVLAGVAPVDGQVSDPDRIPPIRDENPWAIVLPIALGVLLVAALAVGRMVGRRWWVYAVLVVVLGGALGYGISLKQDQQAQSIGAVLCTSCVGIEEAPHQDPLLSQDARSRIEAIAYDVELLFFSATWCHACPYAKGMVRQVAEVNPAISYQVIDVDEARDVASRYGIVQSGRTIVPAILRVDTGEIVFGIEDLEERLLSLLEESL